MVPQRRSCFPFLCLPCCTSSHDPLFGESYSHLLSHQEKHRIHSSFWALVLPLFLWQNHSVSSGNSASYTSLEHIFSSLAPLLWPWFRTLYQNLACMRSRPKNKWMGKSCFFIDFFLKKFFSLWRTSINPSHKHFSLPKSPPSIFTFFEWSQLSGTWFQTLWGGSFRPNIVLFCFFFPLLMIYMMGIWKGNFWNLNIFLLFQSTTLTLRTLVRNNGAGQDCLFFVGRCRKKLYTVKKKKLIKGERV